MAKFQWIGAFGAETIDKKDYVWQKGKTYDLDEKNKRVKTLINLGYLTPVNEIKTTKTEKGAK